MGFVFFFLQECSKIVEKKNKQQKTALSQKKKTLSKNKIYLQKKKTNFLDKKQQLWEKNLIEKKQPFIFLKKYVWHKTKPYS